MIKLASDEGMTFYRNDFTREELFTSDELFFSGTAVGVTPIGEVDGRSIGDGNYPVTRKMQALYESVTRGESARHADWLTYV